MLADVSKSVKAFYDATVELNVANDVVAYTVSDFGRSLTSNGNGSDHAWGGNQFVVGGSVNGGNIFGDYPESLASDQNTDLDVGRGRVIPTMSVDEHAAELGTLVRNRERQQPGSYPAKYPKLLFGWHFDQTGRLHAGLAKSASRSTPTAKQELVLATFVNQL